MQSALILEDQPESRDWLDGIVSEALPGIAVDAVDSLTQARCLLARTHYDLALLDISLPDGSGTDLLRQVRASHANTYVVMATIYDDDEHLFAALKDGAQGFLLKDQPRERLVEQLRGISRGEPPLSPSIARRVLRHFRHVAPSLSCTSQTGLTPREEEVLRLLANGYNRCDISLALEISGNTVAAHTKQIYRKLNVSGRAEATLQAVRLGVVDG
ncbi:response regulator transcription factor [Marinobacter sp.]|uniref:response regulator transcription factor n=1 Tax=Marinobacter sp. TaxID=50741 RepID=UPI002B4656CE|nr:response regulator transcription factor [Marinobacter sp.]HKK56184.1 response regulator transcription factor [Marinobacter sp.]